MAASTRGNLSTRPDASMLLLTNLMENSLDEGYAQAAARQAPRGPSRPGWVLAVGLVAVGLLLATAAAQTRDRAPAAAEARAALTQEVRDRTAANDRLERDLDRLRDSVAQARSNALELTSEGSRVAETLRDLETVTGAGPVVGPALVVHLEDAPDEGASADTDPRAGDGAGDGRLTDRDLQTVVNELWAAGAEAIAVNGQRLTAKSAIRSAGEAILVDFRPLSPPYDVVAVGDADRLNTTFVDGFGGSYVQVLGDYGIEHTIETRDRVRLPASAGLTLRYAIPPAGTEDGS